MKKDTDDKEESPNQEEDKKESKEETKTDKTSKDENKPEKESKEPEAEENELVDKISNKIWVIIGIIIILALAVFAFNYYSGGDDNDNGETDNLAENSNGLSGSEESVQLEFYVMSQCPYGTQVENGIAPVLDEMGDSIDLQIDYIATDLGDGEFRSLHGQPEVDENIRQLCAMEYNPGKYMDYILCQNEDIMNAEDSWESCAEDTGLDVEVIRECAEGEEGAQLLVESLGRAQEKEARASPTIYLNGEPYEGGRDPASFKRAICNYVEDEACDDVQECTSEADCPQKEGKIASCRNSGTADAECVYTDTVEVGLVVLNDENCETCDTTRIITVTKQLFPGVVIEEVDVNSEAGQALVDKYDITYAPSYIFSSDLEDTNTWESNPQIRNSFEAAGKNYKLRDAATGATYFIDEEKRQEQEEQLEKYPETNLDALGYDSGKPRLDYFVMAFCPFGNPADEAASQLYGLFEDKIEVVPHYIVSVSGSQIQSLHGEQEGNQGIRELCVLEEYGYDEFFEFTLEANEQCSSSNADTCWEDVADSIGIDPEVIETCEEDNKLDMAQEQSDIIQSVQTLRQGQLVNPTASPTFLINGATHSGARDAETLKTALCAEFDEAPAECEDVITTTTSAPTGSC